MADNIIDIFSDVEWYCANHWPVEGRGFPAESLEHPFHRLPAIAKGKVPDKVWELSTQPAGLSVRFVTDSPDIFARWRMAGAMDLKEHDTALRRAGLDLYGRDENGKWYHTGFGLPWKWPESDGKLNKSRLDGKKREYRIYLPHCVILEKLEIGIKRGCICRPCPEDPRKPIVYWGTSIVHGARVSRPGMSHFAILQRRLDWPMVNLGFSGNGRMDTSVAEFIATIPAQLFIIDCLPNMVVSEILERLPCVVEILRKRQDTPILFVGDRLFGEARFLLDRIKIFEEKNEALVKAFKKVEKLYKNLYLLEGRDFFGEDGSVDGSHPNDLGAMRMAETMEPIIRQFINV